MHRSDKAISGIAHPKSGRGAGEKDGFRPDIEGLRGVAVALVVFFHAGMLSAASTQLTGGFIGVDLFFVISGFLITGLLIRERERSGRTSFSRFYARRVRRILPAAAVTLLVTLVAANELISLVDRSSVMEDGASAALSIGNIRFAMTTDYFHPVSYSPFLHFWSLGVEEQFYFVWPALLAIVAWKMPRIGVGLALSVVIVVSFVASALITETSSSTAFYMLPTRAWQLAAGGLLAVWSGSLDHLPRLVHGAARRLLAFAGWAALAALITAAFAIDNLTTPYPGTAAIVPTLAGVLLIASGTEPAGPGVLLRLPPVRFLGKISYSLYLWHWPILILGGLYLVGVQGTLSPDQALALAALAIPVATVSWFFVEEPFRRGVIPLPRPSRIVAAGVAAMLALALVSTGFDFGAQSELASLEGPEATPTNGLVTASPAPTTSEVVLTTPVPNASPTPVPEMTPALTPAPDEGPPTSYAITSSIRPALGKAESDYELIWRNNCVGWRDDTTPDATGRCVFGNPSGSYTVALVGDSHGSALFPGVNEVAKAHGWKLIPYVKINCSFLDMPGLEWGGPPAVAYPECETWNRMVISRLVKHPPNLVIISMSRWIYSSDPDSQGVTAQTGALIREIGKIPKASKVVIIADPPLPTANKVPTCLSKPNPGFDDYRNCSYTRTTGFGSSMGYREKNAAKATGAGLIDLTGTICPGTGNCPVVQHDMIMWRDQHHLTATYSTSLGPAIDAQLVAILVAWARPSPSPSSS